MIILETYIFTEDVALYMKLNWNFKMWGAVGIVMCLLLASGVYMSGIDRESQSVSIVARVNDEGSGIFIKSDRPDLTLDDDEGWDGLTFMTPGPSSIQHMILNDIVTDLGMKFIQRGTTAEGKVVYWTQVAPGQMTDYMFRSDRDVDGGIAWEPHYSAAVNYKDNKNPGDTCKEVITTDVYSPGHPCCVIAVNNGYLEANEDTVKRFLAAYVKSVQWINNALDDPDSDEFDRLVDETVRIGMPSSGGEDQSAIDKKKETVKEALYNIRYTYELDNDEAKLSEQLEEIIEVYKKLNIVQQNTLTNAGFASSKVFTEHLVQGTYLDGVFDGDDLKTPEDLGYTGGNLTTINVAYLAADIHQMALHIGVSEGFFEEYGIHVDLKGPYAAGGDVMNALLSKHANLGFVGSPPVVSSSVNALRS